MRKFIGIGVILILFVFLYRISYHMALTQIEEKREEYIESLDSCYYIQEEDGYVTVYYADQETVYEYTNIPMKSLPLAVQMEVDEGKCVSSLSQVYGFLENYSS